ncbi:Histone-lysine N-methyltransferase SETMAR [Habropoda laboriosa]|uniref:Histone-lysine N-methyltransferase SETMAR n=1 Tax=Habropoda laboriosa TaxID=597456 RepID=A0A0L7QRE8_9HYME|nr:Histone-lysine N-methyltransferase SETMAR [Habropoda laboriosa]
MIENNPHHTRRLLELGWDVVPHPPYSPDLAPSDFHLFRSLQNSLNGKDFNSLVEIKNHEKSIMKNLRSSGRTEFSSCLKDGERLWNRMALI